MGTEENKPVVRRFVEDLWDRGKLEVAEQILHPATRGCVPSSGVNWVAAAFPTAYAAGTAKLSWPARPRGRQRPASTRLP